MNLCCTCDNYDLSYFFQLLVKILREIYCYMYDKDWASHLSDGTKTCPPPGVRWDMKKLL